MTFEDAERRLVNLALRRCGGDKPAAAEALGISLKTLYNKIKGYGVDVDQVLHGDSP
jgi:DNA-binding NtrC family response regulator